MHQAEKIPEVSDETKRKHTIRKLVRTDDDMQVSSQELRYIAEGSLEPTVLNHAVLLADPRLSLAANAGQKVSMMNQLQQQYGNMYVQMIVSQVEAKKREELSNRKPGSGIVQRISAEKGAGQPLDHQVRSERGAFWGHDLGGIGMNLDFSADRLREKPGARVSTTDYDIFNHSRESSTDLVSESYLLTHVHIPMRQQLLRRMYEVTNKAVQQQAKEAEEKAAKPSYDMGSPVSNATEIFYDIDEPNLAEVHKHFKFTHNKEKYAGETRWNVGYGSWSATKKGSKWFIDPIPWVIKSITVELPKWKQFSSANEADKKEWARFIKCTRIHEQGHVDRVRKFMNKDMPQEWKSVSASKFKVLQGKLKKVLKRVLAKLKQISDKYDADTGHGTTQKAVLKPPSAKP